ncbi:MAG: hypothetical protein AAFP19_06935 [Bacteroidota bacterium]
MPPLKRSYQLNESAHCLDLNVPSIRSRLWRATAAFQIVLYFVLILLSIVLLIKEPAQPLDLLLIFVGIAFFAYLGYSSVETFVWLQRGVEHLRIDKENRTFVYYKEGLKKHEKRSCPLDQLEGFAICPELNDYVDVHPRYGTQGGAICFWIAKKRYRMGIALSKEEAQTCTTTIKAFLKKPMP